MSDNSNETTEMIPYVISTHSEEWAHMMNDLSGRLHDIRREHHDNMTEVMTNVPRNKRAVAEVVENEHFQSALMEEVSQWTSQDRINFYVYTVPLREFVQPIMEDWELSFALFCK